MVASQSPARILPREELTSVKNLFLLNPGNKDFLLGTKQRRANVPTLIVPILIIILVAILIVITAAGTSESGADSGNVLTGAIILFVIPGVIGVALTFRAYQRALRLDTEGQFVLATITSVNVRERNKSVNVLLWILAIIVIILAIIDLFSNSGSGGGTSTPSDFYELTLEYTFTTPTGRTISGKAKHNRPDLRIGSLPQEGDPLAILYVSDIQFKPV